MKSWWQLRCEETGEVYKPFKSDFYMTVGGRHIVYNKKLATRLKNFMFRRMLFRGLQWQYDIDVTEWRAVYGSDGGV